MTDLPILNADDVAVVRDAHITKAMLDRLMEGTKRWRKLEEHAFPRRGSKGHRAVQNQTIQLLVQREMYAQKAEELGITFTAKQIDDRREQQQNEQLKAASSKRDQLYFEWQRQVWSEADVRDSIRDQLITEALVRKATAHVRVGNEELSARFELLIADKQEAKTEKQKERDFETMRDYSPIAEKQSAAVKEWAEKLRDEFAEAIRYAPGYEPPEVPADPEEPEWFDIPASERDEKTGLYNHRSFQETLEREAARAQKDDEPMALVLLDIEGFRSINDRSYREGDRILREVARRMRKVVGLSLKAYRIGSHEFAILVPGSKPGEADQLLKRLHAGVSRRKIGYAGRIYLSAGVAELRPGEDAGTFLARAQTRGALTYPPEKLDEGLLETAGRASFGVFALDLPAEEVDECRLTYHPPESDRGESISLMYKLAFRFAGQTDSLELLVHETAAKENEEEPLTLVVHGERMSGQWGERLKTIASELEGRPQVFQVCKWKHDKQGPTTIRFEREGTQIALISPDVALGPLLPLLKPGVFRRVED